MTWKVGDSLSVQFIGNSNFDFVKHIQNVKFCQSNAVKKGRWNAYYNIVKTERTVTITQTDQIYCMMHFICCVHSRGEAIDHVSISDNNKVQPATSTLPSCSYTHLVAPGLQKIPCCLQQK